jgi:general secretion pathway protein K
LNYSTNSKGVALITALLIVALATIIAVAMTTRQQLDIHRTSNIIKGDQAYIYALGGESWAKSILLRDQNQIDSLDETWATQIPPLPIPGGTIQLDIEDLQARYNINNLLKQQQSIFERLLTILEIPTIFTSQIIDKLNNEKFINPSEIRLLSEMTPEYYQKIISYIATLPNTTPININTAPLTILMALNISKTEAEKLIIARKTKAFNSRKEFLETIETPHKIHINDISVSSDYFLLKVQVQIDKVNARLYSVLHRQPNQIKVVMRTFNNVFH